MDADVLVEAAQNIVAAIDHRHIGAEAGKNAGKLQRDIAAALDHDALRQFRQMKCLVRGNHVLDTGNRRAVVRRAPGRDQDVFRPDRFTIAEAKRVGILENGAGLDNARAGLFDVGGIDALEPRDLLVLVGDQRRPVEGDGGNRPAKAGGILDLLMDVRSEHEQLFRHATADHAGTAHPVLFGDHDAGAIAGGDAGCAHPAGTASDHEQIDVELSHCQPRSRLIPPIRFACRACASRRGNRH